MNYEDKLTEQELTIYKKYENHIINQYKNLKNLGLIILCENVKYMMKNQTNYIEALKIKDTFLNRCRIEFNRELIEELKKVIEYRVKDTQLTQDEKYYIINKMKLVTEERKKEIDKELKERNIVINNVVNTNKSSLRMKH